MVKLYTIDYSVVERGLVRRGCTKEQIAAFYENRMDWLARNVMTTKLPQVRRRSRQRKRNQVPVRPDPLIVEHLVASVAGPLLAWDRQPRLKTLQDLTQLSEQDLWGVPGLGGERIDAVISVLTAYGIALCP